MSDNELTFMLIDVYINLQRILNSNDSKKEAEYQLKVIKAKLEAMGIEASDLDID